MSVSPPYFKMDDQKLIRLVHLHPAIYNPSHSKYLDSNYKLRIWTNIAQEIGESAEACKARWYNMRDNFRRSIQKQANRGQGRQGRAVKPYKYQEDLHFLVKFFDGKTTENFRELEEKPPEDYEFPECVTEESDSHLNLSFNPANAFQMETTIDESSVERERTQSKVIDYFINNSEHPVDKFLASLAPTLKELHPCDLFQAKAELFAIVQKYELKLLKTKFPNEGKIEPPIMIDIKVENTDQDNN